MAARLAPLVRSRWARQGVRVELAERAKFPRTKVCGCCLGGSGIRTLESLGVADWATDVGQSLEAWTGYVDGREIKVGLPTGIAISRQSLDTKLLEEADRHGVIVHREYHAKILDQSRPCVGFAE